ncbi:MAG: hypothetical protein AB1705_21135 [Verrucomicrobiota bacterium]
MFKCAMALAFIGGFWAAADAAEISLPTRPADAPKGAAFAKGIANLDSKEREREIRAQVAQGNVPLFWRRFVEIKVTRAFDGRTNTAAYFASPDYLAIGADDDYFLAPVTPETAQAIADSLDCVLPTRRMVEDIYAAAAVKLAPKPIPPSAAMTTVAVFEQHNETVRRQRAELLAEHPLGALVGGHKKDVVLTARLANAPGKVAIYGWHQPGGKPIQPLYLGHASAWVDYSHGARFVQRKLTVNGEATTFEAVLANPKLASLLSDEGPLSEPRYGKVRAAVVTNTFNEQTVTMTFDPGVRAVINSPIAWDAGKPVKLVLYALPNGNTIEQTIGRKLKPGDDWHYDIQHIGAQTRWLREHARDANLVVAYLECAEKSWPAWRRQHDTNGKRIAIMVDALRRHFANHPLKLVLTGHSGGGSFTFGYLNGIENIPSDVERIAFLDSNYAYDATQGHAEKLARWLAGANDRYLCVLAYHDSIALLNGKTFVSEAGGTWGRSHAMQQDLAKHFEFTREADAEWQRFTALGGRVKFLLKENPAKAVLHTRQVEWNGFIHALLAGAEWEGNSYAYFGPRAYEQWIAD